MNKSIIPDVMQGVIFISGRRGYGKSWLASQVDAPNNVLFLDYDNKGEGIHNGLHFANYYNVSSMAAGGGSIAIYNTTIKLIASIEKDQYTTVILDNISQLEIALRVEAMRDIKGYAKEFGLNEKNIIDGKMGGVSTVVNPLVNNRICSPLYAKGIKVIVATSQATQAWSVNGPIRNKWNAKGADRWQDLSVLTLMLVPGDFPPTPSAIVQKEALGKITYNYETEEFNPQRYLPLRLPRATFGEIREYLKTPADLKNPKPGEIPTDAEMAAYSENFSQEQLGMIKLQMETENLIMRESLNSGSQPGSLLGQASPIMDINPELIEQAKILYASTPTLVISDLIEKLNISMPMARRILKTISEE
jgi:hypothetical protein